MVRAVFLAFIRAVILIGVMIGFFFPGYSRL